MKVLCFLFLYQLICTNYRFVDLSEIYFHCFPLQVSV
jgi:hypothetical protein